MNAIGITGMGNSENQFIEFYLPDLGEGLAEVEIVEWLVDIGQEVKVDQDMLTVSTDKALVVIPVPYSGRIQALHGEPGEMVNTGSLLVEYSSIEEE